MGFLQHRLHPRPDETKEQAFKRLLDENELECDRFPWDTERWFKVRDKVKAKANVSNGV